MEHVVAIFYDKINKSDFTCMYNLKKPDSGGGQSYIQAAGCSNEDLEKMFKDADYVEDTDEYSDAPINLHARKKYTFTAYEVGNLNHHDKIELAPRTNRVDYRICRQNIKHRHPAWQAANGFPEPRKDPSGRYIFEEGYPGIIDNLYILIIKTVENGTRFRYYATYVDSATIPDTWPDIPEFENLFKKNDQENNQENKQEKDKECNIIFFNYDYLRFTNRKANPFQAGSAVDEEIGNAVLPENLYDIPEDAVEFADKVLPDANIDYDNIKISQVSQPDLKRKKSVSTRPAIQKKVDYVTRQKNLKQIGDIGEKLALKAEKERLIAEGRQDLADKVEHTSSLKGDGFGYDIKSYEAADNGYVEKYIEVKATTGGINKPFHISANEVKVSEEKSDHYYIYRFFGVSQKAKTINYYAVKGSVKDNFDLEATDYTASIKE